MGTHKGEILALFLTYAPQGHHFGFEPIPGLFNELQEKFKAAPNCKLYQLALADEKKLSTFNYVTSNPAYSGLQKRKYDRPNEKDMQIQVQTDLLDNLIPADLPIAFIKIDVEGAELSVLKGASKILSRHHPLVVFECGLGGSDVYGTTPQLVYSFFSSLQYRISLLDSFILKKPSLTQDQFIHQFDSNANYYFIAHPQE